MANATSSVHCRCARCGEIWVTCTHTGTAVEDMDDDEASRVKARYALGRHFNPDHDAASYRDDASRFG
ncbi:MAG: hypothetical protein KGL39_55690 [Patescibacteria group bacterium]|nr:hypothetical protein [Patescibacteria group bacterium]